MKNILLAAVALVAISTAANAADGKSDFQGFYAGLVGGAVIVPDFDDTIWGGGITLGYNWDVADGFILGLEADALASSYEGVALGNASLRMRAGVDLDGFLLYGTAGIGGTGAAVNYRDAVVADGVAGFVGGGGVELMMGDGVSIKAEGLYRGETGSYEVRTGVNFNF